jgi:transcriptional regulator with XRE-family HTH domain
MSPDTEWFKERFKQQGYTGQFIASKIGADPAVVTRLIQGKVDWSLDRAIRVARLLDVTLDEVAKRIGYMGDEWNNVYSLPAARGLAEEKKTLQEPKAEYTTEAKLLGSIDENGVVTPLAVPRTVVGPANGPARALRVHALGLGDGALLYVGEFAPIRECLNRVCLVETQTEAVVRVVRRAAETDRYDLVSIKDPTVRIANAKVERAAPIEWVKV